MTTPSKPDPVEQFLANGVAVLPELFDPAELRTAWLEAERRLNAGILTRYDRFVCGPGRATPGPLGEKLELMYTWGELRFWAQQFLGSDCVSCTLNRLLLKDSGWSGPVELHQDYPYFLDRADGAPDIVGENQVSFFIPLLTVPLPVNEAGGLIFVKGSHRLGPQPRGTIDRHQFGPQFSQEASDFAPEFRAGDVIAMHWLTWHYSLNPSRRDHPRPVMQIVYSAA